MRCSKGILLLFIISTFVIGCFSNKSTSTTVPEPKQKTPKVAILGMLHFVSKNNTVSQGFTEVKSARRQAEIKDMVKCLKKYRPTKIVIERPYRSDETLNESYRDYLNGSYELTEEETDQVAFRLAKELDHERLYLAYSPVKFDFDSAMAFAKSNEQYKLVDSIIQNARELAREYDRIATKGTLKEAVYYLNTREAMDKNHLGYILLSQIGDKENQIGADVVGDWYKSNFKIFENIRRAIDSPTDRILVLYGQGHLKILNQLVKDSPELELVDINDYLKK